jgi:hypothetical protein
MAKALEEKTPDVATRIMAHGSVAAEAAFRDEDRQAQAEGGKRPAKTKP